MTENTLRDWLSGLSDRTPTPGGGAAAAQLAAIGAALTSMVANYTTGKKWEDRADEMANVLQESQNNIDLALEAMRADMEAFSAVGSAYKLPRDSEEQADARKVEIEKALRGAAGPPSEVGAIASSVVELCARLVESGNPSVASDIAVAAYSAAAALESASVNIEVNAYSMNDIESRSKLLEEASHLRKRATDAREIGESVREGLAK